MRVLHFQKVAGIGGSERHLLSLLPALAEAGTELRMCVAATGRASDFTDQVRALGLACSVVSAGPDLNPLLVSWLRREIDAFQPDLVHTHLIHADLHGQLAARTKGAVGVSSIHEAPGMYRREPYRTLARLAGRSATRTIAISKHVKRFAEDLRLRRAGTIHVIPYGIDGTGWAAADGERTAARSELGLADHEVAIGVASRLVPRKGHAFLIQAYAEAARQVPNLRLLTAGDGPLRADLERRAEALGANVDFLGFVSDIRAFMGACDVLAFPTHPQLGEGFGLAALEAMAAGRPVVATAVASLPELVKDGETGRLVDPEAVDELTAALVNLAQDDELRGDMGARGRERALAVFPLETMVQRTLAVYDEALSASSMA